MSSSVQTNIDTRLVRSYTDGMPVRKTHDALPLKTVSRMTGLTPDVIRVWEKRYGVVSPRRGPRGARLYAAADVTRLLLLRRLVDDGRAIGDVARLSEAELSRLGATVEAATGQTAPAAGAGDPAVQGILAAIADFDAAALHRRLSEALMALGSSHFCQRVAAPLLTEVGNRWADGRFTIADEHLLSAALRNLLDGIVRIQGMFRGPAVVLATPSGERHEFGLLFTALSVAEAGLAPWYLGPDLPAQEILTAARRARAVVVGLAVVNGENDAAAAEELRRVEGGLPAATELWLGGSRAPTLALGRSRARIVHDRDAFERELIRLHASLPRPV